MMANQHVSVVLNAVQAYGQNDPTVVDIDGDSGEVILRFEDGSDLTVTVAWDTERRDES